MIFQIRTNGHFDQKTIDAWKEKFSDLKSDQKYVYFEVDCKNAMSAINLIKDCSGNKAYEISIRPTNGKQLWRIPE